MGYDFGNFIAAAEFCAGKFCAGIVRSGPMPRFPEENWLSGMDYYDRFLEAYGKLKQWDDTLSGWAIDPRRMSWTNTNGDVANYRRNLESAAKRHFSTGEPLQVPDDIFNYFANFSRIPVPSINYLGGSIDAWFADFLGVGFIDCGVNELTDERPFNSWVMSLPENDVLGAGYETAVSLFYSADTFTNALVAGLAGDYSRFTPFIADFLPSQALQSIVKNGQRCRHIYFIYFNYNYGSVKYIPNWRLILRDNGGSIVDMVGVQAAIVSACWASPLRRIVEFVEYEITVTDLSDAGGRSARRVSRPQTPWGR